MLCTCWNPELRAPIGSLPLWKSFIDFRYQKMSFERNPWSDRVLRKNLAYEKLSQIFSKFKTWRDIVDLVQQNFKNILIFLKNHFFLLFLCEL